MTWETDFRRFEKTDMDYIPGRKDHTGVLLLDWDWHRIGVFFIIRDARAVQRLERVFTFSFPSTTLFFLFGFLCSFSASCSLSCLHGRSGRVSLPSALSFRMFAPMFFIVQRDGITGPVFDQIRSDQSTNQSKEKQIKTTLECCLMCFD